MRQSESSGQQTGTDADHSAEANTMWNVMSEDVCVLIGMHN